MEEISLMNFQQSIMCTCWGSVLDSWRLYLVIYAYASVFVLELDDFES
jgi:hypothetical protein